MSDLVAKRDREREKKKKTLLIESPYFHTFRSWTRNKKKIHTINNVIFNRNHWQIENRHFTTVAPLAYEMKSNETRRLAN